MAAPINTKFCIHAQYLATPAIGVMTELIQLSALYRFVEEGWMNTLQRNSEVYLIKFQKLTSARAAKRHMDEKSFFGGLLHNTRLKLQDGRYVNRTAQNKGTDDVLVDYYQNYICHSQHKHYYYDLQMCKPIGTPSSSGGNRWMVKRLSKNPPPAPKMDMVDESLNTTANMVRNTLKKVYSWSFFLKSSQQRRRQSQESLRR
uniref:Uncharacterized protein n=1 Tax=Oncorhynchus tshawytscha TaxID=74940 RepID=A0AAZ3S348_ONCTS